MGGEWGTEGWGLNISKQDDLFHVNKMEKLKKKVIWREFRNNRGRERNVKQAAAASFV